MRRVEPAFRSAATASQVAIRLDIAHSIKAVIQASGLSYAEVEETYRLFGPDAIEQDEVIRRIFRPCVDGKFNSARYGNGDHPVLYCSVDKDTAIAETSHYLKDDPWLDANSEYRDVFELDVTGICADLCSLGIAELTHEDYTYCQKVGAKAVAEGVCYLLCPSARSAGTNCPVFSEGGIGLIRHIERCSFSRDPASSNIVSTAV